jgi:Lrp/AsnC family leucine-responsive transcriptional regulator
MEVSLEHPKYYDVFAEMVRETESIQSCYYLTGEYDFMLKIFTDSSDSLEKLHRKIKSVSGVQSTRTHFVLKSVKSNSSVIPEMD